MNEEKLEAVFDRSMGKVSRGASPFDALLESLVEEFGSIYFLSAGPFVKIGYTRWSVKKRIAQLSTGCPYDIQLLAYFRGSPALEREFHAAFAAHHARGEWFHANEELLAAIENLFKASSGVTQ